MSGVLIDSCTVIDIADSESRWHEVSVAVLESIDDGVPLLVNPVIYAECSVGFGRLELLESFLDAVELGYEELPKEALFVAGAAFLRYRRRGGTKTGVLPDFFIGAHAAVAGFRLVTRDVSRFAGYFPRVELVVPGGSSR